MLFPPPAQRTFRRQLSIAFAIALGLVALLCIVFLGSIAYLGPMASAAVIAAGGGLALALVFGVVWGVFAYRSLRTLSARYERALAENQAQIAELEAVHRQRQQLEAQLIQSQKLESIGLLAGGIAHDFNNLLTIISGGAELAREALPVDHMAQSDLKAIQEATYHANALTHQLLVFASKQSIVTEIFSLNELLQGIATLLRRTLGAAIELSIYPAPDLGPINADRNQIEQVLLNLTINARDAMSGSGRLVIETANVQLDSAYCLQHPDLLAGSYIVLSVSDNGQGIPPDIQPQIFEPFFTTKERGKGTGLGLSTSYGIVKQYGGSLQLYSEVGYGTTFKVYLPCAEPKSSPVNEIVAPLRSGNEALLLVEDQELVRSLATRLLVDQGYTVLSAATGEAGLQLARAYAGTLDLLLVDMVLPDLEGLRLVEQIAAMRPDIKILFLSGYSKRMLVGNGRLALEQPVLHKPFTAAELLRSVRAALDA